MRDSPDGLRALERELDAQLFRRRPRGVELTDAGSTLLNEARAILAHIDHASAAAKRTARGEQGHIAVGFTSSTPFHPFVPRIIRSYRDAFPLVALTLEEGGTMDLIDGLRDERIDMAFVRTAITDLEAIVVSPLLEEAMVLALPRGHMLARRTKALSLKALAKETFIVYLRHNGPGLYDAIRSACNASGFSPRIGQEAPRIVSTLNLVAARLGISLVPESLQRMRMDGVVFRRIFDAAKPMAPLYLACRRGDTSPAVRRFLELVKRSRPNADTVSA
jgi:DNA-binding transcriptional LysR family regulator